MIEQSRKEDHLVRATIKVKGSKIAGVPCKIFLPERIYEKPYIILKPSIEDAGILTTISKCRNLFSIVHGFDGKKELTIEAPLVYFSGSSTKHWGSGISGSTVPGEPQDLHIIQHRNDNTDGEKTNIVFWVSPNSFLTPSLSLTTSYTGDIECDRVSSVEFLMKNKTKLIFDQHFRSKKSDNGDHVQWSFLVASADVEVPAVDVSTVKTGILADLDDFLLIASFAARQRTACLGWSAIDRSSVTTFYRGNYVFPKDDRSNDIDSGVIDINDFEKYMDVCYSAFLEFDNKRALRNSIYSVFPPPSYTVETSFLKLFAGLEALVLSYKRSGLSEFILGGDEWRSLKKYLKKCIKRSNEPKLKHNQRASMYSKLDELNRMSLRESFDLLCDEYSIDLSDLWPIFRQDGQVGLVEIRNKLIHGDPLTHEVLGALLVAKEHLKYTLERMILSILKWNIKKSKVNSSYLKMHMTAMKEMPFEKEKLSEYMLG